MRRKSQVGRIRGSITAVVSATAALTTMGLTAAQPATAQPATTTAASTVAAGQACTAADLGKRHPFIKTTEVAPTVTHFKGWYVTQGTTGSHSVTTSTQTTISVR
ncbi:hypothetical protein SAVIM40S_04125 [Streptomyces avidinii]